MTMAREPRNDPSSASPQRSLAGGSLRRLVWLAPILPMLLCALIVVGLQAWSASGMDWFVSIPLVGALAAGGVLALVMSRLMVQRLSREVGNPSERILATIDEVRAGRLNARTGLDGAGEVTAIARALDELLEQRFLQLAQAAREGQELAVTVTQLAQSVNAVRARDLATRARVPANSAAVLAESLNGMTDELRRMVLRLQLVSQRIEQAVTQTVQRSQQLGRTISQERHDVLATVEKLGQSASAITQLAEHARAGDEFVEQAMASSAQTLRAMEGTVQAVERSHQLVQETEKRLKRLAERNQEIADSMSQVRRLADRTGVVALNASLKAAAAGEAGRAFAAVGDEVKRLSESTNDAARQIDQVLAAAQTDMTQTVRTVNHAIEQVVELTGLAQRVRDGVNETRTQTEALAIEIQTIAQACNTQSGLTADLLKRVNEIRESGSEVDRQLTEQSDRIVMLVQGARSIRDELSAFKISGTSEGSVPPAGGSVK